MSVDLVQDTPVRIPTVGPGSRLLRMHVNPEVPVDFLRDDADNWFIRGTSRVRVRLVVQTAIPRAAFGSDFDESVEWSAIDRFVPPQPAAHQSSFNEVAQAIGISKSMKPREVVRKMVEYFRGFEPSDDPPRGRADIYLDLALSKKGVCRHRAFAFLVTALNIGLPARMVVNEAHAWVEVYDATLWHRIDLGGAALNLDQAQDPNRPPYVPPPDPYAWPASRDSAQDMVDRWRSQQQSPGSDPGGDPGATDPNAPASSASPSSSTSPLTPNLNPSATPVDPSKPAAEVVVGAIDSDVRRGLPLHLKGEVTSLGSPCAHVRVDIVLVSSESPQGTVIGSLSTDDRGAYDGAVVVPRDLGLGDYELVVATPGDSRCSAGRSR